jgi:hypothetical protein
MTRNCIIYSGHVVLLGQLHAERKPKCDRIVRIRMTQTIKAFSFFVEGTT